jgi:uncharacterized protein (DUF4415 family)
VSSTRKETKRAASSRRAARGEKKEPRIVSYTRKELEQLPSETDWARVDAMTEEEIEAAARADPEWEGLLDIDWSDAELVMPRRKEAISIRLDEDVLSYFKNLGAGYQTRINAVLRHFMEQTRAKRK